MIADHIHDALGQVKKLRELILAKKQFMGYSGRARIMSAGVALAGTVVLASGRLPKTETAHLCGWGVILLVALILNYASLGYWILFDPQVRRDRAMIKPAVDAVPALAVGGLLSLAAIRVGQYDLLFGIWMCLYGLAQVAYRQSLPAGIYMVGLCYIVCGSCCLLSPAVRFLDPWPMGGVFFAGEIAGGAVLIMNKAKVEGDNDTSNRTTNTRNGTTPI